MAEHNIHPAIIAQIHRFFRESTLKSFDDFLFLEPCFKGRPFSALVQGLNPPKLWFGTHSWNWRKRSSRQGCGGRLKFSRFRGMGSFRIGRSISWRERSPVGWGGRLPFGLIPIDVTRCGAAALMLPLKMFSESSIEYGFA